MKDKELYRNRKNRKLYLRHGELVDCTNSRDGTRVIAYSLADETRPRFVREAAEFAEKFEKVTQ